ncbi:hypothetical protein [Caulobacter sp. BP25]|uniref:hypothetical protein n=1 Tax=Caulobacter sp. BP25 TaxID=2048900 RepID=UPI000C12AAE0|nr:hypothetical protein [Caulobacter sp. BP25]PHY18486.1 hypothetical protein CSW59_17290 [Caulobacter sp. BP25]
MRVIPPLEITEARLTSSNAPEPAVGEAAYAAGTTYAAGAKVIVGSPTATVTISNGAPAVITWASHGQADGTIVVFSTTGTLPAGLVAGRVYFIVNRAAGAFQVSEELNGAPITTTSAGSGVHTATCQVHRIFESLQDGNSGRLPTDPGSSAWWMDVGPTNRWAMFDLLRNTATTVSSPLNVTITPGERIDAIGLVGLVADAVTVTVTVSGIVRYTQTLALSTRTVTDYYGYFFAPFTFRSAIVFYDLPPYTNGVISIAVTRNGGKVSCGGLVIGRSIYLGSTIYDAVDDAENYSKITRDDYGTSTLVPRRSVPKTNQSVRCPKANVKNARDARSRLNAEPGLWFGLDDLTDDYFEALLILGIYKQFSIRLDRPDSALVTLELEEV